MSRFQTHKSLKSKKSSVFRHLICLKTNETKIQISTFNEVIKLTLLQDKLPWEHNVSKVPSQAEIFGNQNDDEDWDNEEYVPGNYLTNKVLATN